MRGVWICGILASLSVAVYVCEPVELGEDEFGHLAWVGEVEREGWCGV